MRSLGYLFLESDFVRIFDELYKGQQVVDFDMFLTLLDKIKPLCATETEIRQAFLVAHKKIFSKQVDLPPLPHSAHTLCPFRSRVNASMLITSAVS